MNKSSRRHFLATTGAGAAAVGAITVVPGSLAGAAKSRPAEATDADFGAETGAALADSMLIACVGDLEQGVVTVVHGHDERTVSDRDLARRIAQLSGSEA